MKKYFIIVFLVIVLATIWSNVRAYTFDGNIDPKNIFSYKVVENEQIGPDMFILSLRSETLSPVFMVACVRIVERRMQIVAYAYWDKDNNLKHFIYSKNGHYVEMIPDDGTLTMLMHKLQRLQEMWGV